MGTFGYHVLYRKPARNQATADRAAIANVISTWVETGQPLRAVLWSVPKQRWIYAPGIAAQILYDDMRMDEHEPVDRATAERIAREVLGAELPTEQELRRMFVEGAKEPHL